MIFRNERSSIKKSKNISSDELLDIYGLNSYEFTQKNKKEIFVCSKEKELDLIELDQLLQTVGWSRRPIRRVKRAFHNILLIPRTSHNITSTRGSKCRSTCITWLIPTKITGGPFKILHAVSQIGRLSKIVVGTLFRGSTSTHYTFCRRWRW